MQNYDSKTIVSPTEVQALRELIFNRARQRAEALANDVQTNYTSSFRDEIMDIARKSFNAPDNPFSQNTEPVRQAEKVNDDRNSKVGFKQKSSEETIKEIIRLKNEASRETISQNERDSIMNNAGDEFVNKRNFTGALNFLNTQAGIYMASKNKTSFEALA